MEDVAADVYGRRHHNCMTSSLPQWRHFEYPSLYQKLYQIMSLFCRRSLNLVVIRMCLLLLMIFILHVVRGGNNDVFCPAIRISERALMRRRAVRSMHKHSLFRYSSMKGLRSCS